MRILITNDDGVGSPGIHELARQIEGAGYEVVVAAPDHDASGTGAALGRLSTEVPVKVTRTRIEGVEAAAYGLSGPPALCVIAAQLGAFGPAPAVVVSGINAGLNTGRSTLHSGTVGAALAGQNFGMRGLAVSLAGVDPDWHWGAAAEIAVEILPHVLTGPERGALNLNVPGLARDQIRGIRWAGLAQFGSVRSALAQIEEDRLHFHLEETGHVPEEDSDLGTVRAGYAALTSLHGSAEVWGPIGDRGEAFDPEYGVHGASAGHELRPPRGRA